MAKLDALKLEADIVISLDDIHTLGAEMAFRKFVEENIHVIVRAINEAMDAKDYVQ